MLARLDGAQRWSVGASATFVGSLDIAARVILFQLDMTSYPNLTSLPRSRECAQGRVALVVEDHLDTQSALAAHLEQHGWTVTVAADGEAAIRLARAEHPQLVCLDLNLPSISGYDVCERIRSDPALECAVIMMMSARTTIDVRAYSLEAGADAYVAKPYDLDEVLCMADRLCRRDKSP